MRHRKKWSGRPLPNPTLVPGGMGLAGRARCGVALLSLSWAATASPPPAPPPVGHRHIFTIRSQTLIYKSPKQSVLLMSVKEGIESFRPDFRSPMGVSYAKLGNYILKLYLLCYVMLY